MRLFDRTGTFTFTLPGEERVTLRYPSDSDWANRARKHPTTRQVNGDEMISSQMDTGAFDLQLIKACRIEGAEVTDQALAKRLVNHLDRIAFPDEEATVTGTHITITAKVLNGKECSFKFKMPTQGSLDAYLGAASVSAARVRKRELKQTTVLEPGGEFFDRNIVEVEGYADDGVPLNHKAAVAAVLADAADAKLEPELVEDPLE